MERCSRQDFFMLFCLVFPWAVSSPPHTLRAQSPAQAPARPSCSWTQTHRTACDLGFAPAKNSLGLTVCVADSSGTEHPEMPGSTWIFCQEGRGGRAKRLLNSRHVPSSAAAPLLLSRQDEAGSKEAVVVESG